MTTQTMTKTMRMARFPAVGQKIELVEVPIPEAPAGHVRIHVEACGICHSDVITLANPWHNVTYPRAPGHEIAGSIDAVGDGVVGWKAGDRVGVGWHGGHDGTCDRCRRGDFGRCRNLLVPGQAYDGGYSEYVIAPAVALARIPDELTAAEAAPLMCAGVTTYNSLRHSPARAGDRVVVLGIGGLGHLGVQYANKMGFKTIAVARGKDKEALAKQLGAHVYIDSQSSDVAAEINKLGGAKVALSTVTVASAMEPLLESLETDGQLLVVGAASEPLPVDTAVMIGGRQSIRAWPSGTNVDSEDTMNFSALSGVRSMNETMPVERAQEAFDRMMSGAARFRMVLTF